MSGLSPTARGLVAELIRLTGAGRMATAEWLDVAAELAAEPSYRWECPTVTQHRLADGAEDELLGLALVDEDGDPFIVAAARIDQDDVSFLIDTAGVLREFGPRTVLEEPPPCVQRRYPVDVDPDELVPA